MAAGGIWMYGQLESDFLPEQDEGAFVIDYFSRPGTSLTETNRMLMHVEEILRATPEVESFSRRTGARLALAIAEPNTGDFLVKLKQNRTRSTAQVIEEVRRKANAAEPALQFRVPRRAERSDRRLDLVSQPRRNQDLLDRHSIAEDQSGRNCAARLKTFPASSM